MNPDFHPSTLIRCCRIGGKIGDGGKIGAVLRESFGKVLVRFRGKFPVWVGKDVVTEFVWE
jgi:hypothetical protein